MRGNCPISAAYCLAFSTQAYSPNCHINVAKIARAIFTRFFLQPIGPEFGEGDVPLAVAAGLAGDGLVLGGGGQVG